MSQRNRIRRKRIRRYSMMQYWRMRMRVDATDWMFNAHRHQLKNIKNRMGYN